MKKALIAAPVALIALVVWYTKFRTPPDITYEQAKAKAQAEFENRCGVSRQGAEGRDGVGHCGDYALAAEEPSPDKRFKWSFSYDNDKGDPGLRILVLVGQKGLTHTAAGAYQVDQAKKAALAAKGSASTPASGAAKPAAPTAPGQTAAAAAPAPAPPTKPGPPISVVSSENPSPLGWTLCELPAGGP